MERLGTPRDRRGETEETPRRLKSALERVQDYIARRDHSEKELRTKLKKYHSNEEIEAALREAQDSGWMAEPEVLAERVTLALGRRGKGHHYIQAFLKRKGLPTTQRNRESETEKARALLEIKLRPGQGRDKALRLLRNRGYDLETISQVLRSMKWPFGHEE